MIDVTRPARPLTLILTAALTIVSALVAADAARGQGAPATLHDRIDTAAEAVQPKVVAWRRDFHQNPELSNREVRTSTIVADHLRALGLEVRTGVAKTGVVGVLKGAKPGPVVALRADMDALPVVEETGLPFASTVKTEYNGQQVGVMHACGHDMHTAMLMGAAEVLAAMRGDLPGTVVFLFQPAEEGAPRGEEGGAEVMIREGALDSPKVEAVFGLHVFPFETGGIVFRPEGIMAAGDTVRIRVRGRQTHGALPWAGTDPITVAAQVVLGLQTIVSRQIDLTKAPAVITIGMIRGGHRSNIIPDEVTLELPKPRGALDGVDGAGAVGAGEVSQPVAHEALEPRHLERRARRARGVAERRAARRRSACREWRHDRGCGRGRRSGRFRRRVR